MLGSNCKVCDLSPTSDVWDSSVRIAWPWALQAYQLAFVVWFILRFVSRYVEYFVLYFIYLKAFLLGWWALTILPCWRVCCTKILVYSCSHIKQSSSACADTSDNIWVIWKEHPHSWPVMNMLWVWKVRVYHDGAAFVCGVDDEGLGIIMGNSGFS